jgi:hypothetical protein
MILIHVTCYTASLYAIHFKRVLNFGEGHGSFLRSDWEAFTTVTIELPGPDQLWPVLIIYMCAPHARRVPAPEVSVLCRSNADRIEACTTEDARFFGADEVLARDRPLKFLLSDQKKLVEPMGFESTDGMETKEFCGAAWPSKVLIERKEREFLVPHAAK